MRAFVAFIALLPTIAFAEDATFTLRHLTPETALRAAQAALAKCRADGENPPLPSSKNDGARDAGR